MNATDWEVVIGIALSICGIRASLILEEGEDRCKVRVNDRDIYFVRDEEGAWVTE